MNIYVGGANGSGKSAIIAALKRREPSLEIIHATTLLMNDLGIPSNNTDAVRSMPADQLRSEYARSMNHLIAKPHYGYRVIDAHYLTLRNGIVEHITGEWLKSFDGLVLTYANPSVSWNRIIADSAVRNRSMFAKGITHDDAKTGFIDYIHNTKTEFYRLAAKVQRPHLFLDNSRITANHSAEELLAFMRHLG